MTVHLQKRVSTADSKFDIVTAFTATFWKRNLQI